MHTKCANQKCKSPSIIKDGTFYRPSDGRAVQRYKCNSCKKRFSAATFQNPFGQNKRRINHPLFKLLCSGVSMRRAANILDVHRITIARKLAFLASVALDNHVKDLNSSPNIKQFHFDDLLTIEHSKCKPLSVTLGVEPTKRKIMGFEVSVIPAFGHLAKKSRERYGVRPNKRPAGIKNLFRRLKNHLDDDVVISSDEDGVYPGCVKKYFPKAVHKQYKGAESRAGGLGELKNLPFDPLFPINHTFAMLRANINRLFRKTWCTTKKKERLEQHLAIYMHFHNTVLIA